MSGASLADRLVSAADHTPTLDAVVIYRPDLRKDRAAELAAERYEGDVPAPRAEALTRKMPPGAPPFEDFAGRAFPCHVLKVCWPVDSPSAIQLYGKPEWTVYVYGWERGDRSTWRRLEMLCQDAARTLLGDRAKGDKWLSSWFIHLAERCPAKITFDWIDLPADHRILGWRPASEGEWWAVHLKNVFDLSAKAVRELTAPSPPVRPNRRELERTGVPDNYLAAAFDIWLWYTQQGCWEHFGSRIKQADATRAQELIAEYSTAGHELNARQSRLRTEPYGVVPLDSPGFNEWDARVKAVQRACVAALGSGNPFGHYDHNTADALITAIEELRNAGRGFGWPPQAEPTSPTPGPDQSGDTPPALSTGDPDANHTVADLVDLLRYRRECADRWQKLQRDPMGFLLKHMNLPVLPPVLRAMNAMETRAPDPPRMPEVEAAASPTVALLNNASRRDYGRELDEDALRAMVAEMATSRGVAMPAILGLTLFVFGRLRGRVGETLPGTDPNTPREPKGGEGDNQGIKQPPRLVVELECTTLILDGTRYDVPSEQALRWVAVLARHPGQWFSARELEDADPELVKPRTDRLKNELPLAVQSLIESQPGRGSRLRLA